MLVTQIAYQIGIYLFYIRRDINTLLQFSRSLYYNIQYTLNNVYFLMTE